MTGRAVGFPNCPYSPLTPHQAPWVSSLASSCTEPGLFIEYQMLRVNFASSCRSIPSQVPELIENQTWRLEAEEAQPGGVWGRERMSDTNAISGVQTMAYTLVTDSS